MDTKTKTVKTLKSTKMRKLILASSIILIALAACKKTDDLQGPNRLFRPVLKDALLSDGNWIAVSWQPINGAASYTVELSSDTFRTIVVSANVDTNYYLFDDLRWEQLYQVQVKANAPDSSQNSKFSNLGAIKTPRFPTILNVPGISDIGDNAVRVSWTNSGAAVTDIKILKAADSSVVREVALSETDVNNMYRIVSGLSGSTDYIVFLYSGASVRGWANFTTKAPLVGDIVDLRDIEDKPTVLRDTLDDVPSGSIILLKRGATYTISTTASLDKSVTIMSGTDLLNPSPANISLPSNFNIVSGAHIDSIVFKDVNLIGTDYASKYVFNINTACNVGKISFEACHIQYVRGVLRTQSQPAMIGTYKISNCIIDSVAGYGIITVDVASSKVNDIVIENSTMFKAEKIITSKSSSNSITIENCTINEAPRGGNYFIDYAGDVTLPIAIRNCIIGIGKDNSGNRKVNGYRVGAASSVDVSGTYTTNDREVNTADLPSLISYTRPSTELWRGPYEGDFTIVDGLFPGKNNAGDPRWRP